MGNNPPKEFDSFIRIIEMNSKLIQILLKAKQFSCLVPFSDKVLEIDPDFYHYEMLKVAIAYHQFYYVQTIFNNPTVLVDLKKMTELYGKKSYREITRRTLCKIPPELGQLSNLSLLYFQKLFRNISDNKITLIPPEIGQLSNLQCL
jgi:hypothetical protein